MFFNCVILEAYQMLNLFVKHNCLTIFVLVMRLTFGKFVEIRMIHHQGPFRCLEKSWKDHQHNKMTWTLKRKRVTQHYLNRDGTHEDQTWTQIARCFMKGYEGCNDKSQTIWILNKHALGCNGHQEIAQVFNSQLARVLCKRTTCDRFDLTRSPVGFLQQIVSNSMCKS